MTAPVRDPRPVSGMVGPCYRCGKPTGSLARVCIGCAEKEREWEQDSGNVQWPKTLTPEQRGDIRRACIEVRRLAQHEHLDPLWRAATETLHELNEFTDKHGETL